MKCARSLVFLLLCYNLSAGEILLDSAMSKDEQRKTGVSKLSPTQKMELEAWLNRTFTLKAPETQQATSLSLSLNIDNGKKIQLSDNSLWEIAPADVAKSAVWITPFPVAIEPSGDLDYPFLITNKTTGNSVKARKVG